MEKHTPEPWVTRELQITGIIAIAREDHMPHGEIYMPTGRGGINDETKANAARIVACVNACEGIPTEALEAGVVKEMYEALKDVMQDFVNEMLDADMTESEIDLIPSINKARGILAKIGGNNV